jgi:hypothetical protein
MAIPKVEFNKDEKFIEINFSKFFELEDDSYDKFYLSKKRSFATEIMLDIISDCINKAFLDNIAVVGYYLNVAYKIQNTPEYSVSEMVEDTSYIIYSCIDAADKEIENIYVNQKINKRKVKNIELEFTDLHAKIILKISFIAKIIIPLITQYMKIFKLRKCEELFLDIFNTIFDAMDSPDINIKNKIFKIVESRIKTTQYSDKIIWTLLSNMSDNAATVISEFNKRLIADLIPKLNHVQNPISFLHVALRNLLNFKFQSNFSLTYTPINLQRTANNTSDNNDKITNFERLEFHNRRVDEAKTFITSAKLFNTIFDAVSHREYSITKDELKYYKSRIQINILQQNLLFLHIVKKVGRYRSLYNLRFGEYVALLIIFRKYLKKNGFYFLSEWIITTFPADLEKPKKVINTKTFNQSLIESKTFINLHDTKYSYIIKNILKRNLIQTIITTLFSNQSVYIQDYENHINDIEIDPDFLNSTPLSQISNEVLKFIETI